MAYEYKRLNRDDAAVLLVDHQAGLMSLVRDMQPDQFKNNVLAVADVAEYFNLPTILTTSFEDGPNGPLMPELKEKFPDAPFIPRPGQIIAGVVTEVCVAFPALSAIEAGFDVFVITDASGTFNDITRNAAWDRMSAAGVQLISWFAAASELHRDWRRDVAGLGTLFANHIPDYKNLMDGYSRTSQNR